MSLGDACLQFMQIHQWIKSPRNTNPTNICNIYHTSVPIFFSNQEAAKADEDFDQAEELKKKVEEIGLQSSDIPQFLSKWSWKSTVDKTW